MLDQVKALTFDVFGTVVDWRGSITREGEALARTKNIHGVDWAKFAEAWRALYQPMMQEVRSGRRPWTTRPRAGSRSICSPTAARR